MSSKVPDGWAVKAVGEIAAITMGQSPPSSVVNDEGDGLPFIQGNAEFGARYPTPRQFAVDCPKVVEAGDVLLSVRAPVGEVNVAPVRLCIGRGLAGLRPTGGDHDFLYFALSGLAPVFARLSQGSTFDAINGKDLRSIPILLPPLDEQRRIAEVLRSVDRALERSSCVMDALKSIKHGALADFFARDPLPTGWAQTPVRLLGAKAKHAIVDGPFGSNLKSEHYRGSGIPVFQSGFVTSSQFKPTKYVFVDQNLFQQQIRSRAVGGDILMAKIGAQAGRCAIIPMSHPEGIIAGNCLKISTDPDVCFNEFLHALLTFMYSATGLREIITETAQPAINLARLREFLVPLPPLREQVAIMETIHAMDLAIEAEAQKHAKLTTLKSALMSDLLSGRVRVPA